MELDLVKDFGGQANNLGFDNSPALNAYLTEITSLARGAAVPSLNIPAGKYRFYQPALCQIPMACKIKGEGRNATMVEFVNGPWLVAPPASQLGTPPMGTDTTGSYYILSNSTSMGLQSASYDLGIDHALSLDGKSAISINCWCNFTSFVGGPNAIFSSSGRRLAGEPITSAAFLGTQEFTPTTGYLQAHLQVGGVSIDLNSSASTALVTGQPYLVSLTYDGSTVSLWQGAYGQPLQLAASKPATGTITQPGTESMILGYSCTDWPFATLLNNQAGVNVYQFTITDHAEWMAGQTTPASIYNLFTGHNLVGLNAWASSGIWIQSLQHQWLPVRYLLKVFSAGVGSVDISEMTIGGSGMQWMYTQRSRLDRVTFQCAGTQSFGAWNNCYENDFHAVEVLGGSKLGFWASVACGPYVISGGMRIIGSRYPLVQVNGAMQADQIYFAPSAGTEFVMMAKGAGGNSTFYCSHLLIDAETGTGVVLLSGLDQWGIYGGHVDGLGGPPITVDGGRAGYIGPARVSSPAAAMIHVVNKPSTPILLVGATKPDAAAWADDMTAVRVI